MCQQKILSNHVFIYFPEKKHYFVSILILQTLRNKFFMLKSSNGDSRENISV